MIIALDSERETTLLAVVQSFQVDEAHNHPWDANPFLDGLTEVLTEGQHSQGLVPVAIEGALKLLGLGGGVWEGQKLPHMMQVVLKQGGKLEGRVDFSGFGLFRCLEVDYNTNCEIVFGWLTLKVQRFRRNISICRSDLLRNLSGRYSFR